jgi:hypothetical protein
LRTLAESGADLWLVHDRAVVFGGGELSLGPWEEVWTRQLSGAGSPIEVDDALAGVDASALLFDHGLHLIEKSRWIWPVAPGQRHLVEALAVQCAGRALPGGEEPISPPPTGGAIMGSFGVANASAPGPAAR